MKNSPLQWSALLAVHPVAVLARNGRALSAGIWLAIALLPAIAAAQTKPVTVTVTRVEQLGADFDLSTLGDFYARVTINGITADTFDDAFSFPPPTGFIVPTGWMTPPAPWVITQQVPFALNSVAVKLELFDDDSPDPNDPADLNPSGLKDAIDLVVDLSTGKWSGDLNWPQACVSGTGGNGAGLCFDISILSPSGDADADTLLDGWEINGYNDDKDELLDVNLPAMGANALRKDIFLELDSLVATTHTHVMLQSSLIRAVLALANAPVGNPDGTTGIQLHIDVGTVYGPGNRVLLAGNGGVTGEYADFGGGQQLAETSREIIRTFDSAGTTGVSFFSLSSVFFNPNRIATFRYAISGHNTDSGCTSGNAFQIPGQYFMVTLGGNRNIGVPCWQTDGAGFSVGNTAEQAGTLLHELGHTLGLLHGGVPGEVHEKPNYISVMNYGYQMCTVPTNAADIPGGCDFSRINLDPLDETDLDECRGIDGSGTLGFGPMNWNGTGGMQGASNCQGDPNNVDADINRDGICITPGANGTRQSIDGGDDLIKDGTLITDGPNRICNSTASGDDVQAVAVGLTPTQPNVLVGYDDWANVQFRRSGGASASGVKEADSQTIEEARNELSNLLAPTIGITKLGPATGQPGQVLNYTVELRNTGNGPALGGVLTESQPGSPLVSDVGLVIVGPVVTRTSTFTVPANACPGDFTAVTTSLAFKDFGSRDRVTSISTPLHILDVSAPAVMLTASPNVLWSPDHKFVPIRVTVVVEDNCDPNPAVRLISITSNEPATGFLGNGDKGPDVNAASLGTDDRAFEVRSERGTGQGSTGRVYTILYRVTDGSGNATDRTVTVTVPTSSGP